MKGCRLAAFFCGGPVGHPQVVHLFFLHIIKYICIIIKMDII